MKQEYKFNLIVDQEDKYRGENDLFYIHPSRLDQLKYLKDQIFAGCEIRNTPVDQLSSMNMSHILKKMEHGAYVDVIICQPISVMQEYDSKQVEANAKLAGFTDFATDTEVPHEDHAKVKFNTIVNSFSRPIKEDGDNNKIEVSVKKTTEVKKTNVTVAKTTKKTRY